MKKSKIFSLFFIIIILVLSFINIKYDLNEISRAEDKNIFYDLEMLTNNNPTAAEYNFKGDSVNIEEICVVMSETPPLREIDYITMINNPKPTRNTDDLPSYFSWKDFGGDWTTPAKDQASCGSCWAFGALGAMEAAINIASGDPDTDIDLSEQYVLSCLGGAGSCNGGWHWEVFNYGQSTAPGSTGNGINGITIESCMPYQAVDWIPCSDKCTDWDYVNLSIEGKLWEIEDWGWTNSFNPTDPSDWDIIKTWLLDYGPCAISFYATSSFISWGNSNHGPNDVYTGREPVSGTNHAVSLVGWKDDPSFVNGGYWIFKNSWGTDFGYNGFYNIEYGLLNCMKRISWVLTTDWPVEDPEDPEGPGGPGPVIDYVFADFGYRSLATGDIYLKTNELSEFIDKSSGPVVQYEWDLDGDGIIDSTSKNPKWTYTTENTYEIFLRVWNEWGMNHSITRLVQVKDKWPPVAMVTPEGYGGKDLEINFEGRLSYDPDGIITAYHWNFGDGTTSDQSHVKHTFPEADKIYTVTLTVTDNDGITSTTTSEIKIDHNVPPETTAYIGGLDDPNDETWFKSKVLVEIYAEDWTGVSQTYYKINSGDWENYKNPFYIFDNGISTIEYYSVDVWGNEENVKQSTVKIDLDIPTLSYEVDGTKQENWYITSPRVTITASDIGSGIENIIYKVGNSAWTDYEGAFNLPDGTYVLWVYAFDYAGNAGCCVEPITVNVDTKPPETRLIFEGEGTGDKYYQTATVKIFAIDAGSGVETIQYKINGGATKTYNEPFIIDTTGEHSIQYFSTDQIGNTESTQTSTVTISPVNYELELTKPTTGLYIFGTKLFNIDPPIIIGKITITLDIQTYTQQPADISQIEFQIDGTTKHTINNVPYQYEINERLFGQHTIKVTAHSNNGQSITTTKTATFYIF